MTIDVTFYIDSNKIHSATRSILKVTYLLFSSAVPVKKVESVVTCDVCKVAMQYLEKLLKGNTTEAAVRKALDGLCGYLPGGLKTEVHIHLAGYGI